MKRNILFFVLLMTALSFIVEATPRCTNGYDPPGMEQTIVNSTSQISQTLTILEVPVITLQVAQEVAFTGTGEMVQADYNTYNQMAMTYLKLNKTVSTGRLMPIYNSA